MVGMEDLALIVKRLEVVTEKLEAVGDNIGGGGAVTQEEKLNISVTAFDDICNGVFKAFLGQYWLILRQMMPVKVWNVNMKELLLPSK